MLPALSSTTPPWQGPSGLWSGFCSKKSGAIEYFNSAAKVVVDTSAIAPNVREQRSKPAATREMNLSMADQLAGFSRLGKQRIHRESIHPPATPDCSVQIAHFVEDFSGARRSRRFTSRNCLRRA